MTVDAIYYDGRTARPREVRLFAIEGFVWLRSDEVDRREPLAMVEISERLGNAPRVITFADGARCEVRDHAGFEQWMETAGHRDRAVDRAQRSWGPAIGAVIVVVAFALCVEHWGVPWFATFVADRMPDAVTVLISNQTLDTLDSHFTHPSKLPAERRASLERQFDALVAHTPLQGRAKLVFRSSPLIGPNAMALPDGRVVVLDEIVKLAANDEEIVGVLAHELGHVVNRHGLRLLVQGTIVGAAAAWWLGDVSSIAAAAPAALLSARYSRGFEAEADAYAAARMKEDHIPPSRLADMLERLRQAHQDREHEQGGWQDYLDSHPGTDARVRALRGERENAGG